MVSFPALEKVQKYLYPLKIQLSQWKYALIRREGEFTYKEKIDWRVCRVNMDWHSFGVIYF